MFTKVLDIEHLFCYIIEKNKCLKKGVIQMSKNYRIKSRFRFTVFVVLTIVLMTTAVNFALGLNTAASSTVQEYMDVEIKSGDTLWNIAETYMPDNMDTREAVYQICSLNDISADELYAGMTIQVPVYR
ncbi:MAG: LysM peptidoglycan-binding domain-containing protein [Anaerovoracaceae bacterium]|nr:LysM peptidoglycan-binding domain-containing protein [Anaerovoracaceae bacterium]